MQKNEASPSVSLPETFWVGSRVYWTAGASRREGQVIDIYISGTTKGMSSRCERDRDWLSSRKTDAY
jgi:hypothetical protein